MPDFLIHAPDQTVFPLDGRHPEVRAGRAPDQEIVFTDPAISGRHARFVWKSGNAFLEDLGSRHGCFVNGTRIQGSCRIHPWDKIRLGLVELRLEALLPDPAYLKGLAEEDTVTFSLPVEHLRGWAGTEALGGNLLAGTGPMDILHRLSQGMVGPCAPQDLLADLLERLFTFLDASRGAVLLRRPDGGLESLASRAREDTLDASIRISEGMLGALFDRKEALLLGAGGAGPQAETPTRSIMVVPLEAQGEVLGLLYLDASAERGPFTQGEIRFVASLGNLAAAKIIHERTAEELQRKTDMERQLLALESTARAKGELLAFLSHEIRSPLTALINYVQLALLQDLPEAAQRYVQKADQSAHLLLGLVNETLDFSKLEAGRVEPEHCPFRLGDVLTVVLDMFLPHAQAKGLHLRQELAPGVPEEMTGDPLRLGQVLINLVNNAVKFTETGGILLKVEPDADGRTRFSVADTGMGISPEQLERLFKPYAQGDRATARRFGGTGLGLFISHRLVRLLGGELQVASEPGRGSTFSFSLDLRPGADPPSSPT